MSHGLLVKAHALFLRRQDQRSFLFKVALMLTPTEDCLQSLPTLSKGLLSRGASVSPGGPSLFSIC